MSDTLSQMLTEARKNYFDGLREAVGDQLEEFRLMLGQLNAEESQAGVPLTVFSGVSVDVPLSANNVRVLESLEL